MGLALVAEQGPDGIIVQQQQWYPGNNKSLAMPLCYVVSLKDYKALEKKPHKKTICL